MAITDTPARIMRGIVSTLREDRGGSASVDLYVAELETTESLTFKRFGLTDTVSPANADGQYVRRVYIGDAPVPHQLAWPNIGVMLVDSGDYQPESTGGFYSVVEIYQVTIGVSADSVSTGAPLDADAMYRACFVLGQAAANCLQDRLARDLSDAIDRCDIGAVSPNGGVVNEAEKTYTYRYASILIRIARQYPMRIA